MKILLLLTLFTAFAKTSLGEVLMQVPYYSQYDNLYEPDATCGLTSAAMVISYFKGKRVSSDSLYLRYGKPQGTTPEGQADIYRDYGLYAKSTRVGSRAAIGEHLRQNRIVVIHGWFTESGHIMPLIGYANDGYIVNDPAGVWRKCPRCGYSSDTFGARVKYTFSSLNNSVLSYDGDVWFSVISNLPF
jgi:ABC-type bacteriocin/lantibiotic exporter with double-glycine peptidase domain